MGAWGEGRRATSHAHGGTAIRAVLLVVLVLSAGCGGGGDENVTLVGNVSEPAVSHGSGTTALAAAAPVSEPTRSMNPVAAYVPATVEGIVTRAGQAAVGARVSLVADDHSERVTTADATGAYSFSDVAAGHYEVMVHAESGATCDPRGCISASWAERGELRVIAGQTSRLDVHGD